MGGEPVLWGRYIWVPVIWLVTSFAAAEPSFTADQSHGHGRTQRLQWRVGGVYRAGMKVSASGSSLTQQQPATLIRPHRRGGYVLVGEPAPVGPNPDDINQFGDRDFDDGFVYRDALTGIGDSFTVNWGYRNSEQYDPLSKTFTFHRESAQRNMHTAEGRLMTRTVQTDTDEDTAMEKRFGCAGMALELGLTLRQRPATETELTAGLRYFPGINQSLTDTTFRQTVTDREYATRNTMAVLDRVTDTYTFDYPNQQWHPDPPNAPYDGSGADPMWDPYIDNLPAQTDRHVQRSRYLSRSAQPTQRTVWHTANRVDLDVAADLLQAVAGPRFARRLGKRARVQATIALVLNYLETTVDRHEVLEATGVDGQRNVLQRWHERERQSDWLWGGQANVGADIALGASWSAGVRAGYEWIDRSRMTIGPNRISLDLSSTTMAAFIGAAF